MKTTNKHKKYWRERKIDWKESYQNWQHPHRYVITNILSRLSWLSLFEIGCGAGANLMNIIKHLKGRQLGGADINEDAIALAQKTFPNGFFKVNSADNLMLSDKSVDVVLSDMCLIYVGPRHIKKYIREIKRVSRSFVVLCEFHSISWWKRLKLKLTSGYNAYNWKKLLEKEGFYDVVLYKLKPEDWPGGNPQKDYGYIVVAKQLYKYV
jgi:ubiquinone/menaquinone biosynthesis C-methylase UbiE